MEVRLVNLTKKFTEKKGGKETIAVNDMTITIPSGKLIGLLGPSGCGKSTTLYMIAGLHNPTNGQIFFDDIDVTRLTPDKRGIGLVFQNYALYPHLTVKQNISFPLENIKRKDNLSREDINKKCFAMAKLVNIEDLLSRKPKQLSGGQQQRVAIARSLVKEPKVLLLDEPLSNLDARLRLQTREEIKRIQRETHVTTVFVTHDQEEAMSISDEIVVMNKGVVQQQGEPQNVYNEPDNLFVAKFLGNPPINILEGHVKDQQLYIGETKLINCSGVKDQEVYIGIRPEFFYADPKGLIPAHVDLVEHIGRDTSIIGIIEGQDKKVRIIVPNDAVIRSGDKARFDIKKLFIFSKETEERVYTYVRV